MTSQVRLRLLPSARCLYDDPIHVKVAGLKSRQLVVLKAQSIDDKGVLFNSSAVYRADGNGEIDLERDPSLRGEGPFPAVLDLYTFGGGLSERRACLLANRGFVVLTVALYGHDDLPKKVQELHLDYFEEAIEFLRNAPKVCGNRVGVISLSKSGDLALSIATYLSHVAATVWINGCNANVALPLYYRKRQILAALMFDISRIVTTESGALNIKDGINNPMAEENKDTLIPIEQAMGRFLFVAAADDLNWDSCAFVNQMVKRLKLHGKDNFESIFYPASGHYLEPPYGPYCPSSFHGVVGKPTLWGGEPRSHAAAEIHLWRKIQEFFKMHLISDAAVTKAML
ncbi:acyl-coenzyme A thioesterase 1-like isoform X2 [Lampris incognitus]|uniref:acyl-coenzyme A thioesterase 1-like isoform X2 n=1 Tax=Lampris incognitus TaxID=2546036 RepID=UPI0024B573E7|nr:acyl-coenzyme A thioesterase 1-like isoform X2 [Lampris incognitus]